MTQITASLVKKLRETTGAGMMDCKKALTENNGNFDEATDWLRTKGIAKAGKKSSRVAAEGLIAICQEGNNKAAVVELNSETDFVAKNDQFQNLATLIAQNALTTGNDVDSLKAKTDAESGKNIETLITDAIAKIGENMNLRRTATLEVEQGVVATYLHNKVTSETGKIGALVALESSAPADKLLALGKQIAMHVAAAKPLAMTREEVSSENIERERSIYAEQARTSGKPEAIIEKMVEGRIRKYYEEIVLPEQMFVIDGKTKIADVIEAQAKELGTSITLKSFALFVLGEGIEKEETDFAAEVAAAVGA